MIHTCKASVGMTSSLHDLLQSYTWIPGLHYIFLDVIDAFMEEKVRVVTSIGAAL